MVAALNAVNKIKLENKKTNDILQEADIREDNDNDNNTNKHKYDTKIKSKILFSYNTVIGALAKYISTPNEKFQPMNANFGILPELEGKRIRDKKERYKKLADRSLKEL